MGLENNSGKLTFVNIKEGKLYIKPKDSEVQFFDALSGVITKVEFANETYEGNTFERARITILDGEDKYLLQIRTDSGYFRGFCNSLRMGNPTEKIRCAPSYKKEEGENPQTTFFIQQNGTTLKHYSTMEHPEDVPQITKVKFKGKDVWDGTEQIEYWKNWLKSIQWEHEVIAGGNGVQQKPPQHIPEANDITEPIDDLPF